jgi:hypothetical protein
METVDLGGNPVKAYTNKAAALAACEAANTAYKSQKIADLMAHCSYTLEQAEAYVATEPQFYVQSVEVE